jgi:hypothetical protein
VIPDVALDPGTLLLVWIGVSLLGLVGTVVLAVQVLRTGRCGLRAALGTQAPAPAFRATAVQEKDEGGRPARN